MFVGGHGTTASAVDIGPAMVNPTTARDRAPTAASNRVGRRGEVPVESSTRSSPRNEVRQDFTLRSLSVGSCAGTELFSKIAVACPSSEQWPRGRVTTNMSRSADGGIGRHVSRQAAPAKDSVFRASQGLAAMSHHSISGTSAAPLRALSTTEVLVVAHSPGVSGATTSTSTTTEKGCAPAAEAGIVGNLAPSGASSPR